MPDIVMAISMIQPAFSIRLNDNNIKGICSMWEMVICLLICPGVILSIKVKPLDDILSLMLA